MAVGGRVLPILGVTRTPGTPTPTKIKKKFELSAFRIQVPALTPRRFTSIVNKIAKTSTVKAN